MAKNKTAELMKPQGQFLYVKKPTTKNSRISSETKLPVPELRDILTWPTFCDTGSKGMQNQPSMSADHRSDPFSLDGSDYLFGDRRSHCVSISGIHRPQMCYSQNEWMLFFTPL